ncbi:hypothetical protein SORBI_3007G012500 [Sorghum bicolor]|uniref:Uncharacterized protein n=1 Tax=Sorghum bicolor TaxID=4558 RepID=A0A1B6PEY4_SORBI|nr:hypothetical protein SORBI_3007G012500 [Sorghum bicolor]
MLSETGIWAPVPADCTPPTSEGGSGERAKADRSSKTKKQVEHLLATLEKEGVEIHDKIASIVNAEIAKIKAETSREAINDVVCCFNLCCGLAIYTVAPISAGFLMGADWFEKAFGEEYARTGFVIGARRRTNGEDK